MSIANQGVTLQVGGTVVLIATQYDLRVGVFDQPGAFSLQLGSGESAASILHKYPKNSPFGVLVADKPIFAGFTDGNSASGDASGTEITIDGRGTLKFFYDSFHEREQSYITSTFAELIEKAMDAVGMTKPFTNGERPRIRTSNAEVRQLRAGTTVSASGDEFSTELTEQVGTVGNAKIVLRAKLGERWSDLLQRVLNQQGLFMWDAENGDIVVGRPNTQQPPLYQIVREVGSGAVNNVVSFQFKDDIQPRYSEVVIYGRASGRKYARTQARGAYTDDEMVNAGVHKTLVLHDVDVTSTAHAELIAKRHLAEGRRRAFFLEYVVAGHMTQLLGASTNDLILWTPDTMVQVRDEQLGLDGLYWIESCRYRRNAGGTTTALRLLDPNSLLFGTDAPISVPDPNAAATGSRVKVGVGAKLASVNQHGLFTAYAQGPGRSVVYGTASEPGVPADVLDYFKQFPQARIFEVVAFIRTSHPQLMFPPGKPIPLTRPTFERGFLVQDEFAKTRKATTHITFEPTIVTRKL